MNFNTGLIPEKFRKANIIFYIPTILEIAENTGAKRTILSNDK